MKKTQKKKSIVRRGAETAVLVPGREATYEEFFKSVRLINMGLTHCSASLNRDVYGEIEEPVHRLGAHYRLLDFGKDYFDAVAFFKLTIGEDEKKEGIAPLSIECGFEAHFHHSHDSKAFGERFVDGELRLILWPYFRQFVSDTTARMAIRPIVIPFSTRND